MRVSARITGWYELVNNPVRSQSGHRLLASCIATAFCGGALWAGAGILGFANPLAAAADLRMPRPSIAKAEIATPLTATDKVNLAHQRLLIAPDSRQVVAASFTVGAKRLASQFDLAQGSDQEVAEDRFDAVRKNAELTPRKLAGLFAKPSTAKSARPVAAVETPALERFGGKGGGTQQPGVMLAYATPGADGGAVTAFSALLSEADADDEEVVVVPDDAQDEDTTGLYDETPDDGPLPQLRPNVQPALKPLGSAKQVEPQEDEAEEAKPARQEAEKPRSLAYAKPDQPERGTFGRSLRNLFGGTKASDGVAVYDISAAKVYMPDGTSLEAHSGIGKMADNPRYVNVRMGGATPPHTYNLKMRERLFHGVEAIRMLPVDGKNKYGRDGFLTHSYLLRSGRAESHGCIAFKDYSKFLKAFKQGKIRQIVVVPSGGRNAGIRMASNG